MTPEAVAARLEVKRYQGDQIFRWMHRRGVFDWDRMTDLSKDLRKRLSEQESPAGLEPVAVSESGSSRGTRKALFRLRDGETVESVLIREGDRRTLCLSTQVGCAVKCAFCATGLSGFKRNLTPGEIVEQALRLWHAEDLGDRTPNIVFMGMGEPFRNYDATVTAIRLLMRRSGMGVGARRITVSTAGDVEGIERFTEEGWQVRLSVSLHAGNDELRSQLVPLNRKYPIDSLMAALEDYTTRTGRMVTFEWTLIQGVNDSKSDAHELGELASRIGAFVNVIPLNPVEPLPYLAPSPKAVAKFVAVLKEIGVTYTLRTERGRDIDAACGQLRRRQALDVTERSLAGVPASPGEEP